MKLRAITRPTATAVLAVGALVVALSGTAAVASGALQKGDKLIAKDSLSGNRLHNNTITGKQIKESTLGTVPRAKHLAPLVWTNLTLVNGWAAYSTGYHTPQYALDGEGFVHLRGALLGTGRTALVFASLPTGFRPTAPSDWIPVASTNNSNNPQTVAINVLGNGNIAAIAGAGANLAFVSLEGVEFDAG